MSICASSLLKPFIFGFRSGYSSRFWALSSIGLWQQSLAFLHFVVSGVVLLFDYLSFHCYYMSRGPMSICQIITRDSARSEAARGRLTRPIEHDILVSKHHHHRTWSWRRNCTQYGFVTTVHRIWSFLMSARGVRGSAVSNFNDVDEDHQILWISNRSDRSIGRVTFYCVLQQKLVWTPSKPRFWRSHVQDL